MLKEPVTHSRRLRLDKGSGEMRIDDLLTGKGSHKGVLRFHISPDCSVEKVSDTSVLIEKKYTFKCSDPVTIEECEIAEYFGIKRTGYCIRADFDINQKKQVSSMVTIAT